MFPTRSQLVPISAPSTTRIWLSSTMFPFTISKLSKRSRCKASGIPPDKFFLARFPYPPWYALSTFYLGLMPAQHAGALWFELNLVMLFLSVWFLTDGWNGRLRLISFPLALFFLPVLGALSVGQYDFPVLLGTSLLIYSLRKENVALTTLGAVLLTFKPHIGALILLSVLGWLIVSRSDYGRRATRSIVMSGVFLIHHRLYCRSRVDHQLSKNATGLSGRGKCCIVF